MSVSLQKFTILAFILACSLSAFFLHKKHLQGAEKALHTHIRVENLNRIRNLGTWISSAAVSEPAAFVRAIGTGALCKATSLPSAIQEELPEGAQTEEMRDTFDRPLNIALTRLDVKGIPTKGISYTLLIWSDGPNGTNENGLGDDITGGSMLIQCPFLGTSPGTVR